MRELLYVCSIIFLSTDLFRYVIFMFIYGAMNIAIGIKLPSLLVSILYSHNSVL